VDRVASITLFNIGIMPGCRWHCMARIWRLPVIDNPTATADAVAPFLRTQCL